MKTRQVRIVLFLNAAFCGLLVCTATADVTAFFNSSQEAAPVSSGTTSDTISSEGYLFTYTRDKLFTGGAGLTNPVGRAVRVPWPQGIEAQYVTSGPTPDKARITIRRVDGGLFDLTSFTARLLANAGAGRAIEIVPLLNGEEPLNDPLTFDVSGYYGNEFAYDTSPNYLGSTAALTNYDAYVVSLTLDFALTALTLQTPHVNHAPTDLTLTPAAVPENEPVWTLVGSFDTADPDAGDTFTYSLVGGAGGEDNALFSVSGGDLLTESVFNFEQRNAYSIRVRSKDQDGLSTQRVFTVTITDVEEPQPVLQGVAFAPDGTAVIRWDSLPNHTYTVYASTNLLTGFIALESGLPAAAPFANSYTDTVFGVRQKFWKVSTGL